MPVLQEIKVPLISVNDTSLTVQENIFKNGDKVSKADIIMVFETSKTTYDVIAESDGYIQYLGEPGNDYEVNDVVAKIFSDATEIIAVNGKAEVKKQAVERTVELNWKGETIFSKAAIALLQEHKVETVVFVGKDFINKEDVETYLGIGTVKPKKETAVSNKKNVSVIPAANTNVIVERLSSNKKREIEYLGEVQSSGLTSTVNTFIDTEGIFVQLNPSMQALKNSLLPVTIYETSRLLRKYKELNAYFAGDAIHYYKDVHVGFAIDINKGLKVLNVKDASNRSLHVIEEQILDLSGKYLDDALKYEDLSDITFTITDLSSEGVAFFRPLVNMMNSAILAMSSIDEKLNRCVYSITFDHRVTEGKFVSQFLKELKERLESYKGVALPVRLSDIVCFKCFKTLEEDISEVGFSKCITPKGEESFICQSCLKGF